MAGSPRFVFRLPHRVTPSRHGQTIDTYPRNKREPHDKENHLTPKAPYKFWPRRSPQLAAVACGSRSIMAAVCPAAAAAIARCTASVVLPAPLLADDGDDFHETSTIHM